MIVLAILLQESFVEQNPPQPYAHKHIYFPANTDYTSACPDCSSQKCLSVVEVANGTGHLFVQTDIHTFFFFFNTLYICNLLYKHLTFELELKLMLSVT